MRALQETEPALSPEEILKMVTVNAARALQLADKVGQIHPSLLADLIAVPFNLSARNVFADIIASGKSVSWMMIGGKIAAF